MNDRPAHITANPTPDAAPIRLEKDDHGQWVIILNDGYGRTQSAILPESVVDSIAERILAEDPRRVMPGLQAQVTVIQYANLGDSAAYVRKPLTYDPTETVEALLVRAHNLGSAFHRHDDSDRVELQVIPESIPKPEKGPWDL